MSTKSNTLKPSISGSIIAIHSPPSTLNSLSISSSTSTNSTLTKSQPLKQEQPTMLIDDTMKKTETNDSMKKTISTTNKTIKKKNLITNESHIASNVTNEDNNKNISTPLLTHQDILDARKIQWNITQYKEFIVNSPLVSSVIPLHYIFY